ncbi:MAG TPA: aminotransferase class I/II-fold pyridoxal phosphate-dependent enzyme, partial [Bacteroidia bacterium]|nr:aminotransferase class I/II-fold pyridoxal phosphate-dependent enzyme [Bacteroidia bacterium]
MMKENIKRLEKTARLLEPNEKQRKNIRAKVVTYTEYFLNNIETIKAFETKHKKGVGLLNSPISEKPLNINKILDLVKKNVDTPALNPASGGHLGYIPGGGIYYAALGDYMADITNRYAGLFFTSPGAVRMENMLLKWMANLAGYPESAVGNLTSGGSIANLIAIVSAKKAHQIKSKNIEKTVVYLSEHAHHCIEKALRIAGLEECVKRFIPLDKNFRITPSALEKLISEDRKKGLQPWLVIASAGTTDVGAVDPLDEISKIAKKNKLWYHIDAAYGGFFLLTKNGKEKLKGIEKSDSLVMDPHKGLFLPYGLGTVLVRNQKAIKDAHYYQANYMQDALDCVDEPSPADLSPELTKHFRGFRMWLPLKLLGTKPFVAALEEKLALANYFYKEIQKIGFEVGNAPDLSVVTYRYIPRKGNADAFNKALVEEVQKDGRVFISSTIINGNYTLRLAVLSF